jgi:mevalonate kinase
MAVGYGKLILLGEHSVVYGRPALAASLAVGAEAHATRATRSTLHVQPWDATVHADQPDANPDLENLRRALNALLDLQTASMGSFAIEARLDLPAGAGLGSSAALGVAVLRAIDEARGVVRDRDQVTQMSLAWERVFHGNPSGVDNAMAAGAGVALYRKGRPLEAVTPRHRPKFVVAHSGEFGSTKLMVESVARQHQKAPARIDQIFDGIESLVLNARVALEHGDMPGFGKLMDLNQALLNSLMLSTGTLEEMCGAARAAGALGAKLTGGGGGGCMIALVDAAHEAAVFAVLSSMGKKEAFVTEAGA